MSLWLLRIFILCQDKIYFNSFKPIKSSLANSQRCCFTITPYIWLKADYKRYTWKSMILVAEYFKVRPFRVFKFHATSSKAALISVEYGRKGKLNRSAKTVQIS